VIPPAKASRRPRARRTNEERSAETRGRLIDATVECLNRVGYAATTTLLVNEVSGVTRGGMLHHFPSKVDLLIATAAHCLEKMREARRARAATSQHIFGLMEVERSRFGVALTEIMLGSRSDKALAARFKPVGELILEAQRRAARYIAETVGGVDDIAAVEPMVWLNMGAIRGMTLMELAGLDSGHTDAALRLLRANREAFLARLAREKK